MNEIKNQELNKTEFIRYLTNYIEQAQNHLDNAIQASMNTQTVIENQQQNLQHLIGILEKIQSEPSLTINVKDYLTEEQYQEYLLSCNPVMLCEFDVKLSDWLDWFFQELPFLSYKHLVYKTLEGNSLFITEINHSELVTVNHQTKQIFIGSDIIMDLNGISLYDILNVTYQKALDQHQIQRSEEFI